MNINKTNIRRYRFTNDMVCKLKLLKKYSIKESDFIRIAIEEKLKKDLPLLKIEAEKIIYPF